MTLKPISREMKIMNYLYSKNKSDRVKITKHLSNVNTFLFDMDGTIYLGNEPFNFSKDVLSFLKKKNKRFLFLSNNSSKTAIDYVEKLKRLNIYNAKINDVYTSTEATIKFLKENGLYPKILLLAVPSVEKYFIDSGFEIIKFSSIKKDLTCFYNLQNSIKAVVICFDTTINYYKFALACEYINRGIKYVVSHSDIICPMGKDAKGKIYSIPDVGSFIELIRSSTGRNPDFSVGKPNKYFFQSAISKSKIDKYHLKEKLNKSVAMVGDRLYTDILGANKSGILSILVLSGETTISDLKKLKNVNYCPRIVLNSIEDIMKFLQ